MIIETQQQQRISQGPSLNEGAECRPGRNAEFAAPMFRTLVSGFQLLLSLLAIVLPAITCAAGPGARDQAVRTSGDLQGVLTPGGTPVLKASKREYSLAATTSYVLHTLQDKRLSGREIRVEGAARPDGSFQVEKFFTVHSGKLYRVRYYCETCNIVALEPGRCACCQQPTELQEVPVDGSEQDAITVP